ncbi:ankyrin repeat domain-containing protein [Lusitaniella coriacea LEGE 07157]|uniref:Ankyrin repeat domain-containing protein n=1 Tax=Lusitaniella coriacea LEGE 07157 TaxID=945747 RepID=A0A8J7DVN4_9CYAN|nr:ankyrin repeat domain-containing protein [Lusitaniella coriacea]MBE9115897.1 ankyrin repeat domain-containing protein [Lusitaniella coriacea LEGE 07157]
MTHSDTSTQEQLIDLYRLADAIHEFEEATSEDEKQKILEKIRVLVQPGFEDYEEEPFYTDEDPLSSAVCTGNLELVTILVEAGASANVMAPDDFTTPLYVAQQFGHTEIAEYIETITSDELREVTEQLLQQN